MPRSRWGVSCGKPSRVHWRHRPRVYVYAELARRAVAKDPSRFPLRRTGGSRCQQTFQDHCDGVHEHTSSSTHCTSTPSISGFHLRVLGHTSLGCMISEDSLSRRIRAQSSKSSDRRTTWLPVDTLRREQMDDVDAWPLHAAAVQKQCKEHGEDAAGTQKQYKGCRRSRVSCQTQTGIGHSIGHSIASDGASRARAARCKARVRCGQHGRGNIPAGLHSE